MSYGYTDWSQFIDSFASNLLNELGVDPYYLPNDHNPITDALLDPDFVEKYQGLAGFSRAAMSRVATICQMSVFDSIGGPEGDGEPKALRRHWYAWYKSTFAQRLAPQLGDVKVNESGIEEMDDRIWSQRLSITYAELVDTGLVTYKDLWVLDASRMAERFWSSLFEGCNIVVCVEKDSLFADFVKAAKRLGARAIYSGKGKSSKAAIEKLLREVFYWSDHNDPFSETEPLIVLHVSDHDFDGESVIGPTFGEQARRYTPHVLEARIGVKPDQVNSIVGWGEHSWYKVKVSNSGYKRWAKDNAIFEATCVDCEHKYTVHSADKYAETNLCPICGGYMRTIDLSRDTAYGFEVESLKTHQYSAMFVDALLEVLDFDYIVRKLREATEADSSQAVEPIVQEVLSNNESYQDLLEQLAQFDRLVALKQAFESKVKRALERVAEPHTTDWQEDEDDPTVQDFRNHMTNSYAYGAWQPFDANWQTEQLEQWVRDEKGNVVAALERYNVNRMAD